MPAEIRFHLDENVEGELVRVLRHRGVDVTTAADAGLLSASDEDHVAYALGEARVIFTHDDDFLSLNAQGVEHAGIVYCCIQMRTVSQIAAHLLLIRDCMSPDEMHGHVEYV